MDERRKKILEHLKKSGAGTDYSPKKTINRPLKDYQSVIKQPLAPEPPKITEVIEPEPTVVPIKITPTVKKVVSKSTFKSKILDHVKQTAVGFGDFSLDSKSKKKKEIIEHVRKSMG
ncbi:MAG: hypothetical protein D6756_08120 [Cyanobacteria bacterium J083]|nr:MAG: hypothetical protein D6756_08120 [Cyanobacteria bacterium J083]